MTAAENTISTVVADDHPVYCDGLVRLLQAEPDVEVIGHAGDGDAALGLIRDLHPHVAVLDLMLPGRDAIAIIDELVASAELSTKVVVVSASLERDVVYRAIESGALGYIPKTASGEELIGAIRTVAAGGVAIAPAVQVGLANAMRSRRGAADRATLSPRELEILRLAADGMTVNAIAQQLYVSAATVKTHLHHVYEKLDVPDRTVAVAQAMRLGLLD